jgi:putative ATP-dependent endonuclease of OLD family
MHVKKLDIQHFRGFSDLVVRPQGHVVVMGEPGAGRSDLIEALGRVLDSDASRPV